MENPRAERWVFCFRRSCVVCRESSLTLLVLCPSLRLHSLFPDFQERLEQSLNSTDPVTAVKVNIKYAMKVLCKHAESHSSGGSQATGQVLGMSLNRALDILVGHAAGELGVSPRDVYDAVFRPDLSEQEHANPMAQVNYSKLETYISQFRESKNDPDPLSHQVITVDPIQSGLFKFTDVKWEMNFKSPQIARKAVEHLRREEMSHLRKMFRLFEGFFLWW